MGGGRWLTGVGAAVTTGAAVRYVIHVVTTVVDLPDPMVMTVCIDAVMTGLSGIRLLLLLLLPIGIHCEYQALF